MKYLLHSSLCYLPTFLTRPIKSLGILFQLTLRLKSGPSASQLYFSQCEAPVLLDRVWLLRPAPSVPSARDTLPPWLVPSTLQEVPSVESGGGGTSLPLPSPSLAPLTVADDISDFPRAGVDLVLCIPQPSQGLIQRRHQE